MKRSDHPRLGGRILGLAAFLTILLLLPLFFTPAYTSTRYAPGYSERRFKQITPGTSENAVRSLIGDPLVEFTNTDRSVTMIYSFPDHRYFVRYYKSRGVGLSNGAVTSTWSFVNDM